jgi:hypothetical protein
MQVVAQFGPKNFPSLTCGSQPDRLSSTSHGHTLQTQYSCTAASLPATGGLHGATAATSTAPMVSPPSSPRRILAPSTRTEEEAGDGEPTSAARLPRWRRDLPSPDPAAGGAWAPRPARFQRRGWPTSAAARPPQPQTSAAARPPQPQTRWRRREPWEERSESRASTASWAWSSRGSWPRARPCRRSTAQAREERMGAAHRWMEQGGEGWLGRWQ